MTFMILFFFLALQGYYSSHNLMPAAAHRCTLDFYLAQHNSELFSKYEHSHIVQLDKRGMFEVLSVLLYLNNF
jgi:hypothetical protein